MIEPQQRKEITEAIEFHEKRKAYVKSEAKKIERKLKSIQNQIDELHEELKEWDKKHNQIIY